VFIYNSIQLLIVGKTSEQCKRCKNMAYVTNKDAYEREMSARRMIRNGIRPELICNNPETWRILAEGGERMHIVTNFEGRYNCTCEDYRYHGGVLECKHINVVKMSQNGYFPTRNTTSIASNPRANGDVVINITIPREALRNLL
jgi:hypothetical protein